MKVISGRSAGSVPAALAADVVLVIVFCLLGRRSHDEALAISGVLRTVWPFLTGLAVGWVAVFAIRRDRWTPTAPAPFGLVIWASTLVVGMLARAVSGQGTALSFVLVAATVLAVFLLGWRLVATTARARGRTRQPRHPAADQPR